MAQLIRISINFEDEDQPAQPMLMCTIDTEDEIQVTSYVDNHDFIIDSLWDIIEFMEDNFDEDGESLIKCH
jgi:hypothetical protein